METVKGFLELEDYSRLCIAMGHPYIDILLQLSIYKGIHNIVLDQFEVKPSCNSHQGAEGPASEYRYISALIYRLALLITTNDKACLDLRKMTMLVKLVHIHPYAV